jgi:hypothetical protein
VLVPREENGFPLIKTPPAAGLPIISKNREGFL